MDLDDRARSAAQGLRRAVEVMEMSTDTQQPRKVERFDSYRERKNRNRRVGALALAAALVAVLTLVAVTLRPSGTVPAGPATIPPGAGFTVNVYTGAMTALPASVATKGNSFAVSPLGTKIAYTVCCGAPLHVANLDGTDDRIITAPGEAGIGPQWSPDGSKLVYQQRESFGQKLGNLFVYDVLTGTSRRITNLDQTHSWGWWILFPSFSGDGTSVLYHLPRGDVNHRAWDLWSVPVSGGTPTMVQSNAGWGASTQSGSGWLAYVSPVDPRTFSGNALMIHQPSDAPAKVLVRAKGIMWLRFSPLGNKIAYSRGNYVYVVDVPGGSVTRIAAGGSPEWVDPATLVIGPND